MASRIKRLLFLVHRWMGIALCLFFAIWFVSGVVMMYVGYPKLTPAERLTRLPNLTAEMVRITPRQALQSAALPEGPKELRLSRSTAGQAVYVITPAGSSSPNARGTSKPVAISADTGQVLARIDRSVALASASAYLPGVSAEYLALLGEDTWTHSRALDSHRPLHLVEMADTGRTWLYISSSTGEVVRDASWTERRWGYLGAWLHFLYVLRDTGIDDYWRDIIIWLSLAGTVAVLVGTAVGIQRWRFTGRYGNGSRSPYRQAMMRWHHITGLLFAAIALTWVFSGLMSMNPWKVFHSGSTPLALQRYAGGLPDADAFLPEPGEIIRAQTAKGEVKELRFVQTAGSHYIHALDGNGRITVFDGRARSPEAVAIEPSRLRKALEQISTAPILQIDEIREYDAYYYARAPHTMSGSADRPLPVWRVQFGDAQATWLHIDPATGAVVGRLNDRQRIRRWLFAFLHSWDWPPLLNRRPAWDLLMILLSIGGTILSLTGIVIGWRRLRRAS